jgi:hypothetical protein
VKHFFLPLFIFINCSAIIQAQANKKAEGIYSLEGVMETASAFKLNKDSTFEFYYSCDALDRYGSGKWILKDDSILFIAG